MLKFAANLTLMWPHLPLADRFHAARRAGFEAVELLRPDEIDPDLLASLLKITGLKLALINSPAGDWDLGERGLAILADRKEEFRDGLRRTVELARRLDCPLVHLMAGSRPEGTTASQADACFLDNVDWALRNFPEQTFTLEPINPIDLPDYYLSSLEAAAAILTHYKTKGLRLQFDSYHLFRMGLDVKESFRAFREQIAHIQVSSVPDRQEPDRGAFDHGAFFAFLEAEGWSGWIGAEYSPAGDTDAGLGWFAPYRQNGEEQGMPADGP